MKTKRDIEKLVQWAMREELPKGRAVSASAWELINRYAALGVAIDGGGWRDDLGYVPGDPHPDAIVIAAAIRALDTRAAFNDRAQVLPLFGNLAAIAGEAVDAIMRSTFNPQSLVICHAVQSTRPKWQFDNPTPYRQTITRRDARGNLIERARVVGTDSAGNIVDLEPNGKRGRAAMRDGLYDVAVSPRSPLQWGDPAPVAVAEARAEYLTWHGALCHLATSLVLDDFEPQMPALAPLPWITGQVAAGRVLRAAPAVADVASPKPTRRARIADVYGHRGRWQASAESL